MEFSDRLSESAKHAKKREDADIRISVAVHEEGIHISVWDHSWGGSNIRRLVSFKEIEQCRFNPLTVAIDDAIANVRAAKAAS